MSALSRLNLEFFSKELIMVSNEKSKVLGKTLLSVSLRLSLSAAYIMIKHSSPGELHRIFSISFSFRDNF